MRLLLFLLLPALGFAQTGFRAEFNFLVSETPVEGGEYRLKGLFSDGDALGFGVDSVKAGYFFYDSKGFLYEIVYSNGLQPLTIEVDKVNHSAAPTTGTGIITNVTVNIDLPFETSKLSGKLRSVIEVDTRLKLDSSYLVDLGRLTDVDTTGKTVGSIILYDTASQKWEAQPNSINNLTDGVRGSKYIHLGSIGAGNYNGVFIGNNILQNITDPREGKNVVIGYNIANSERPMIANTVAIGDNQGHMNQFGSTVQSVTIGNNIALGGRVNASVMIGFGAGQSSGESIENVMIGNAAGSVNYTGGNLIMLGHSAQPAGTDDDNEIVIGGRNTYNAPNNVGYGSNTVKIGNPQMSLTGMFGRLLLNGYGAGNREAADLSKTRSPYIAAFATDGTLLEVDESEFGGGSGGASDLGALTDVDTTGKTDGSIILYDGTSGNWEAQANSIDNLIDARRDTNFNLIAGFDSLSLTSGNSNTGYGYNSLIKVTSGLGNTAIGRNALGENETGNYNTAIGRIAFASTKSSENTGVGAFVGTFNKTGIRNTYMGYEVNTLDTIGSNNTLIGAFVGSYFNFIPEDQGKVNFDSVTVLGSNANTSLPISTNEIVLGAFATGNGSNTATLGNNNITATYLKGTTNLRGYGAGNKEAADLGKTASSYIAGYATDGTLIELPSSGLGISLTDLSVTQNSPGTAGLTYNNTNGVFTYTPPDLSSYLTTEVDGSVTNEIQDLSLTGNTLSLSGDATTVDLSTYLDDQTVTLTGGGITAISGTYPNFTITSTEVDGSVTNEIQDLSLTGNVLSLSGDATTVDLTESVQDEINNTITAGEGISVVYDDGAGTLTISAPSGAGNTDEQTLSINSATAELSISNGNTVDLSEAIDAQVNTLFVDGTNIQSTYDDGANTLTVRTTDALTQIDAITFDNNVTDAVTGRLQYDQDKGTLKFGLANNTPIYLGTDMGWYVKNQSGSSIAKGVPVYTSGTDGASGRKLISPMIADGSINAKYFLGITAEAIANGGDGLVLSNGGIKGINLSGFSANDVLYVSPTVAGTFVNTEPSAPNLKLPVGYVVNNVSNGVLSIRTTVGTYLSETHDVQIASASNGEVLKFDGSKWVDGTDLVDDADADPTNEIQTLTISNGLTPTQTGNDYDIEWGGNLTKATTVDGLDNYNILFDNLTSFTTNTVNDVRLNAVSTTYGNNSSLIFDDFTGASITNTGTTNQYTSSLNMLRTGELSLKQDRTYASEQLSQGLTIAAADATLKLFSNSVTNSTSTSINLSPDEVKLITPNVFATTATTGQFLQLTDGATGTVEFATALTAEVDGSVTNEIQDLSLTGNTLSLSSDATTVDLSPYLDDQTVTLTGGGITAISGTYPNFTVTSTEVDGSTTNEIQTISLAGNDLTLSDGGGTVTLPSYTSESTTASNGLTLSGSDVKLGGTLTETTTINLGGTYSFNISESGSNTLFKVFNDLIEARGVLYQHDGVVRFGDYGLGSIDPSPTQTASDYLLGLTTDGTLIEVDKTAFTQDLSLTGNTLSLSGDATTVDLSGYLDNTDAQAISLTSNTLSITGNASTVDLSGYLDDQTVSLTGAGITAISGTYPNFTITSTEVDGSVTNEIQDLSLTANTLSLSGDATTVDLSGYLDDQTVSLTGSGITAISGTYPNFTVTSTEVDGSVSNEGVLSIGTGVVGSSVFIQSNTSTSTPVTISVGDGFDIAASGSTIFLNPEAYAIQSGTSGAISWGSAPQRIHVLDFGANTSITLSFTNVAVGGIYTLRVTGNSGTDTLIWPASAKFEDGTSAGTVTLQDGGQMFTFYYDGTNYWVK